MVAFLRSFGNISLVLFFLSISSFAFCNGGVKAQKAKQKAVELTTEAKARLASLQTKVDSLKSMQGKISHIVDSIKNNGAYQTLIDGKALKFPYAVVSPGQNNDYALIINSVNLTIDGMKAEIFMQIPLNSGQKLSFVGKNLPLTTSGQFAGDLELFLVETLEMQVGQKGYSLRFHGLDSAASENPSYITFDCRGFKQVTLDGKLLFDPETVSKFDSTDSNKKEAFETDFYLQLERLENLLLEFDNIPALQFSSLPGFKLDMPKFTLDLSDAANVPGFVLPTWYIDSISQKYSANPQDLDMQMLTGPLWEGIHIPSITITIPRKFNEGSAKKDVTIAVQDIIFDQFGISALIRGDNLLSINEKADYNGFKATIDSAKLNIITSSLSYAGVWGRMEMPIQKEKSYLNYGIAIQRVNGVNNYFGYAELKANLEIAAFGVAKMNLSRARLDFEIVAKKIRPKFEMDGTLAISPRNKDNTSSGDAGLLSMDFNKLVISSSAPYFYVKPGGYFQLNTSAKSNLFNLPIQVTHARFINDGDRYGLDLGLIFMLQNSSGSSQSSGNGFQASSSFTIYAKRNIANKKFSYDGFRLTSLSIDVKQGVFSLEGQLNSFTDDDVYGKGFCGYLKVEIEPKIKLEAAVIFGKQYTNAAIPSIDDPNLLAISGANASTAAVTEQESGTEYRYWFVDMKATFSPGLPITPGVEINSISGGLYYNMKMYAPDSKALEDFIVDKVNAENAEKARKEARAIAEAEAEALNQPLDSEEESPTASNPVTEIAVGGVACRTVSGKVFVPNKGIFGVMAGIGVQSTGGGSAFNGEINLCLEFNLPGGGLRKIATWGSVNVMATLKIPGAEALAAKATAATSAGDGVPAKATTQTPPSLTNAPLSMTWYVEYDFPKKTLTGDFSMYIDMPILKGSGAHHKAGNISFMACPEFWYVYIGQPTQELMNGVNVISLFEIKSYLCVGNKLPNPAIAPVPDGVTNNPITSQDMMGLGSGFSFGARLSIGKAAEKDLGVFKVGFRATLEAGFDFMIAKSSSPIICSGGQIRGKENWYALGQAYILGVLEIKAGIRNANTTLAGASISAYIRAQLPNPNYYAGNVNVSVKFLRWKKSFSADFESGTKCDPPPLDPTQVFFVTDNYPADKEGGISVFSPIHIDLKEKFEEFTFQYKGEIRFTATTSSISVKSKRTGNAIPFDIKLINDKKTIQLIPHYALSENDSILVTCQLNFQKKTGSSWPDASDIVTPEIHKFAFKTTTEPTTIEHANVAYSYPMIGMENVYTREARRGYLKFLVNPNKSTRLNTGQKFEVVVYQGAIEIERTSDVIISTDRAKDYFNYYLPFARLETGKEYSLKIIKTFGSTNSTQTSSNQENVQTGTVQLASTDTVLIDIQFTTSQYSTFTDKMNSFTLNTSSIAGDIITAGLLATSSEPFTPLELLGSTTLSRLIKLEAANYGNPQINTLINSTKNTYNQVSSSSDFSISNIQNGFDIVNAQVGIYKDFLEEQNMTCLTSANCTSNDLSKMSIPAGEITMTLSYTLPGKVTANSTFNFKVNLSKPILLQDL